MLGRRAKKMHGPQCPWYFGFPSSLKFILKNLPRPQKKLGLKCHKSWLIGLRATSNVGKEGQNV